MRTTEQREQHRCYMKVYRQRYPERVKATKAKWMKRHPGYKSPAQIAWNKSHPHNNDKARYGGLRSTVLQRDQFTCQVCGMTDKDHRLQFGRSITVDHKQGGGRYAEVKQHSMGNLWTLCLRCHGRKDGKLSWSKVKGKGA